MRKTLAVIALAALFTGTVMGQSPVVERINFGPTGASDALASIYYTETGGSPQLQIQLTTADTVQYTLDETALYIGDRDLVFEGATADDFELTLRVADVTADRIVTIPDTSGPSALMTSDMSSNAPQAANGIWALSNTLRFEGSTADGFEADITPADVTADIVLQITDDKADTYQIMTQPDADVTGGHFSWPGNGAADAVTTSGDNVLLCEVIHLPMWLTVANVYVRGVVGADSATDDTVSFAIYENADAGVQLTEAVGADLSATANVTLDVTDVTLGPGMYRMCGCAQDVSGAAFHAETRDDEFIDVINSGAVTFGTAANACVAGDPPATTGALTTADDNTIVFKLGG